MKTFLALVLLVICAAPSAAQTTGQQRADQALLIGGLSMSSVALGITMSCTSAGTCREVNNVTAKWIAESSVKASAIKSAGNGVAFYAAWRFTTGKTRTITLGVLAAINTWDAVHDIRQMRRIQRR
jgi:hypothetical protein